jgi:hypothetical protein
LPFSLFPFILFFLSFFSLPLIFPNAYFQQSLLQYYVSFPCNRFLSSRRRYDSLCLSNDRNRKIFAIFNTFC